MAGHVDASKGWCCDGRTWEEHSGQDGECCQPEGQQLDDLPPEAKAQAQARLAEERTGGDDA